MSDRNQKKPDDEKKPSTTVEKDGAQQLTDAELDRVGGGRDVVQPWQTNANRDCSGD